MMPFLVHFSSLSKKPWAESSASRQMLLASGRDSFDTLFSIGSTQESASRRTLLFFLVVLVRNYPVLQGPVPVINPVILNIALIPALPVVHFHAATMIILADSPLESAFLVIHFHAPAIILTKSPLVPALLVVHLHAPIIIFPDSALVPAFWVIDPPAFLGKCFGGEGEGGN